MATTHAYVGLALAVLSLPVTGQYAPSTAVLGAAFVGGLFPDVDLLTNHRKTLHFPVLFPVAASVCLVAYGVVGHHLLFLLAVAVAAAGLHSSTDVLAGGLGREPWKNDSGRAVYNHVLGRWHSPRRLVRYSGAPEDLVVATAFAVPALLAPATGPGLDAVTTASLLGSATFVASRRRIPAVVRSVRAALPPGVAERLPSVRFEEGR